MILSCALSVSFSSNIYLYRYTVNANYICILFFFSRRLTEIEAKRVTMQLLEGLDYLHNKGIVHCDIKPQNLLFANDPDSPDAGTEEAAEAAKTSGVAADGGRPGGGKQQVASPAGRLAKLCDFGISCKVCVYTRVDLCAYVFVCVCVCVGVCTGVRMHLHLYVVVCTRVRMYPSMCIRVRVYSCAYVSRINLH